MFAVLPLLSAIAAAAPPAVLVMPSPKDTLPRVRELVRLSKEGRRTLERDAELLGFDPLDAAGYDAAGLDASAPVYLWISEHGPLVVEVAVAKPAATDEAIARVLKHSKRALGADRARARRCLRGGRDPFPANRPPSGVGSEAEEHTARGESEERACVAVVAGAAERRLRSRRGCNLACSRQDRRSARALARPRNRPHRRRSRRQRRNRALAPPRAPREHQRPPRSSRESDRRASRTRSTSPASTRREPSPEELQAVLTAKGTIVAGFGVKKDTSKDTEEKDRPPRSKRAQTEPTSESWKRTATS